MKNYNKLGMIRPIKIYEALVYLKKHHPDYYKSQRINGDHPYHKSKDQLEAELYQDKHECPFCHKYYLNPQRLSDHIKKIHPDEFVEAKMTTPSEQWYYNLPPQFWRVRCQVCYDKFQSIKQLDSHQQQFHPEFFAVKQAAKQAQREHLSCKICGKQFENKKSLIHHTYTGCFRVFATRFFRFFFQKIFLMVCFDDVASKAETGGK